MHCTVSLSGFAIAMLVSTASAATLAITEARVVPSAAVPPLARATVLIEDGKIIAVGERVVIPPGAEIVRCGGCTVMAGFWNAHVHFTEPKWDGAATQPAAKLAAQLREMLGRSGFTTVVDTGSILANTMALRGRIAAGEVPGPWIYTAGVPLYPPDGIPYYVKESLPPETTRQLSTPRNAAAAAAAATANFNAGADILKLFTGSWVSHSAVLPMPPSIAAAAAAVAHGRHRLVFAHPSNLSGMQVAIESGVDVLAHAPDNTSGIDDALLRSAIARHVAMIPTLKLFSGSDKIAEIRRVVHRFHELGGELIFGTDTGYLTDYDVAEEFRQLQKCGLKPDEILQMLTENPAGRFGVQARAGRVAPGMEADLTVVAGDPASDVGAFTRVVYTIRGGRIIVTGKRFTR